jgi:hypothetical protein
MPRSNEYFRYEYAEERLPTFLAVKGRVTIPCRVTCLKSLEPYANGTGKRIFHEPCLAHLPRTANDQRFPARGVLPGQELGFNGSFHRSLPFLCCCGIVFNTVEYLLLYRKKSMQILL